MKLDANPSASTAARQSAALASNAQRESGAASAPNAQRTSASGAPSPNGRAPRLLRRVHLYLGLTLLPWVLLYGVSGFLFNHGDVLSGRSTTWFDADALAGAGYAPLDAEALAAQVCAALGARADASDGGRTPTLRAGTASLSGTLVYGSEDPSARRFVALDLAGRGGRLLVYPGVGTSGPLLDEGERVPLDPPPLLPSADVAQTLAAGAGVPLPTAPRARNTPSLHFEVDAGGEHLAVTYELSDGRLTAHPVDAAPSPGLRDMLTGLHKRHALQPWAGPETGWAIIVDLMALAMITWAVTGLVMWWTIKNQRRTGAVVLACSVTAAALLITGLV